MRSENDKVEMDKGADEVRCQMSECRSAEDEGEGEMTNDER